MNLTGVLSVFICGPMIRRLTPDRLVLWWVSPNPVSPVLKCYYPDQTSPFFSQKLDQTILNVIKVGDQAFIHLADVRPEIRFACDRKIEYDLSLTEKNEDASLAELIPGLSYPGQPRPSFMVKKTIRRFFHGSCRKPHHYSDDAFTGLDREIKETLDRPETRPALLMLTGDQIYADDVAGPMLYAIHKVINFLGLNPERFENAPVADSDALYSNAFTYYGRKRILPRTKVGKSWYRRGGVKHIFSSSFAHNHLITFAEWMAMYFLAWSPVLWEQICFKTPPLSEKHASTWDTEMDCIQNFIQSLPRVRRLFAHIPTYMIFDDHDITDDWNLTARWEQSAYGHPFTKQIIGNGLMAYFFCQGWGNAPDTFPDSFLQTVRQYAESPDTANHTRFIDSLLEFKHWHYEVPLFPELVVVDRRTRRWKRDLKLSSPSGLLDWEALMKLQQKLMKTDAVLLVAPAPIFGVKLIELIQRILTTFGYSLSLAVDAENWMGHRKSAYILLEIFKNAKTASYNVIISGDVHYSFAYDIELRFTQNCPGIWQITSSGIKNRFPESILKWLDRINQIMHAPYSPLNWFTKRRDLIITERTPKGIENRRLISACGIGRVTRDNKGAPVEVAEVYPDGSILCFEQKKD